MDVLSRTRALAGLAASAALAPLLIPAAARIPAAAQAPAPAPAAKKPPPNAAINHVVVLMQENRSYDHYFGQLHNEGQPDSAAEPATGNPDPTDPTGPRILPFHQTTYCESADLNHSWQGTHLEIDKGKMDGFTAQNVDPTDPSGKRTMGYYDKSDLPFYYDLANKFGIGDRYFASVAGPTFPNRFYLYAGTSFGHIQNDFSGPGGYTQPTILRSLTNAGISWKVYFSQVPFAGLFADFQQHADHGADISQFYSDAAAGNLPQVSFVDPIFIASSNTETDEHPPSNIQVGERFSASVVNALMGGPNWKDSALFLTYDEHGGYYDHEAPPSAPAPDAIAPVNGAPYAFNTYGVRVPDIVVSPYSVPHFVSHVVNDHTSILAFIELRFGLAPLTRRDAAANPMLEFFNFKAPAFASPPALSQAPVDPAHAAQCQTQGGAQTGV